MKNRLQYQTSPYLLQHADNPVDWFAWGEEAFTKAECEDKPIFLSIGYSTCHWCHVMAHESFENTEIAQILNQHFVCIKVDREERPDVDQIYMNVCQAVTGSGGWPTSLFLTPDKKPFFAGTYFPPKGYGGAMGFCELISYIAEQWQTNKNKLVDSAEKITEFLKAPKKKSANINEDLIKTALSHFKKIYDDKNGGFGGAPKFPTPHNLIFLMLYGNTKGDKVASDMALFTLMQMRKGGIYDHLGGGFSRYSTDEYFLVPHFEKMLYDNALLTIAYSVAYKLNKNEVYLQTAEQIADYVLKEMTDGKGGFYSAQDADGGGGEGSYYTFSYDEILSVIGERKGQVFNAYYGVSKKGNFDGKNILNRLHGKIETDTFNEEKKILYEYRKSRLKLHLDDKILTSWNSLMIIGFIYLYRVSGNSKYLSVAQKAIEFIENNLCENNRLYVSIRNGKRSEKGFLDDYALYCAALLSYYGATGKAEFLTRAEELCHAATEQFWDKNGGFFMSGKENEKLILNTKETYDGAIPSGNTVMFFVLTRLNQITLSDKWKDIKDKQEKFLFAEATSYPMGHSVFLLSLLFAETPPPKIVAVCENENSLSSVVRSLTLYSDVKVLTKETADYKLKNGKTTFYVCRDKTCFPPSNDLQDMR